MKSQILELLETDYWAGYMGIAEELEHRFGIKTAPKKVKQELKELYQIGLVSTGPLMSHDGKFKGTGYFSAHHTNYAATVKIDDL